MEGLEEKYNIVRQEAIEQRVYGDTYRHIGSYIDNAGLSVDERSRIIREIKELEGSRMLKKELPKGEKYSRFSQGFIGAMVILFGVFIWMLLKDRGFVSLLPIIIIGIGLFNIGASYSKR